MHDGVDLIYWILRNILHVPHLFVCFMVMFHYKNLCLILHKNIFAKCTDSCATFNIENIIDLSQVVQTKLTLAERIALKMIQVKQNCAI